MPGTLAKDWRKRQKEVYKAQIRDKACEICVYGSKGGKICKECGGARRLNWKQREG